MWLFVDFCALLRFYLNLPEFTWSQHQNRTILGSDQVNSGKKGVKHKSKNTHMSIFGLIEKNMELSHIYLAVYTTKWN